MKITSKTINFGSENTEKPASKDTKLFDVLNSIFDKKQPESSNDGLAISKNNTANSNTTTCKMSKSQNSMLPKELKNTKMGAKFAEISEQIRNSKTEKGFIVDEDGNIVAETYSNDGLTCTFSKEDMQKVAELKKQGKKIGNIHNHPLEKTLSGDDIALFNQESFDFSMVTTPSGGFASISREKPAAEPSSSENGVMRKSDSNLLQASESGMLAKLIKENESDEEVIKKLNKFENKQLKRFVKSNKEQGLNYEYKAGKNKSEPLVKIDRGANYKQILIKNGYTEEQADDYLELLYKAPPRRLLFSKE